MKISIMTLWVAIFALIVTIVIGINTSTIIRLLGEQNEILKAFFKQNGGEVVDKNRAK